MTLLNRLDKFEQLPLLLIFIVHGALGFPGIMSSDSISQYQAALSKSFGTHHPFMMSYLWHYLDKIYTGPGLLYITHLVLLYSGCAVLIRLSHDRWGKLIATLIPAAPPVMIYSLMLWKDVGFAFSYFLIFSLLSYLHVRKIRPKLGTSIFFFMLLFYGSSVKFHGQFLAYIPLIWFSSLLHQSKIPTFKSYCCGAFLKKLGLNCVVFFLGMRALVLCAGSIHEDHAWQFVKLYDLAAISVDQDKDFILQQNKTPHYTFEKLKERFSHNSVDELIYGDSIVIKKEEKAERDALWMSWFRAVIQHPISYIKHRTFNLSYALDDTPGFNQIIELLHRFVPDENNFLHKALYWSAKILGKIFVAHFLVVTASFLALIWALRTCRESVYATPIIFMNLTGLSMLGLLFFMSMAGTPRYTYIAVCLFYGSLPFILQHRALLKEKGARKPGP